GERALRIGKETRDARQSLLFLCVENVKDRADEEAVAGLFPVVAPLESPFRIYKDIGDILRVAHLVFAAPNLEEWVVTGGCHVGGIEKKRMAELSPPARGQLPIFAF